MILLVKNQDLLQLYAKEHKDVDLMVDVMKLLKANDVPLQPGTADIVFRWDPHNTKIEKNVLNE